MAILEWVIDGLLPQIEIAGTRSGARLTYIQTREMGRKYEYTDRQIYER